MRMPARSTTRYPREKSPKAIEKLSDAIQFLVDNPLTALVGFLGLKFGPGALGALLGGGGAARAAGAAAGVAAGTGGGGAAAGIGLLGKAGLVGAAAAAGVALGRFVDNTTGLSDRLVNLATGEGFTRDVTQQAARETAARRQRIGGTAEAQQLFAELDEITQFLTQAIQQGFDPSTAVGAGRGGRRLSQQRAVEIRQRLEQLAAAGQIQERVSGAELTGQGTLAQVARKQRQAETTPFERELIAKSRKAREDEARVSRNIQLFPQGVPQRPEFQGQQNFVEVKVKVEGLEPGGLIRIKPDVESARRGQQ